MKSRIVAILIHTRHGLDLLSLVRLVLEKNLVTMDEVNEVSTILEGMVKRKIVISVDGKYTLINTSGERSFGISSIGLTDLILEIISSKHHNPSKKNQYTHLNTILQRVESLRYKWLTKMVTLKSEKKKTREKIRKEVNKSLSYLVQQGFIVSTAVEGWYGVSGGTLNLTHKTKPCLDSKILEKKPLQENLCEIGIVEEKEKEVLPNVVSQNFSPIHKIVDNSKKGFGTKTQQTTYQEARRSLEMNALSRLSMTDVARYKTFFEVSKNLNTLFQGGIAFHVDHANSIEEHKEEAIQPNNLQIISASCNSRKGSKSEKRMSFEEQVCHIKEVVSSIKRGVILNKDQESLISLSVNILKLVY